MNNLTNEPSVQKTKTLTEQQSMIILSKEEQLLIKGGATCNCKTTDKRVRR